MRRMASAREVEDGSIEVDKGGFVVKNALSREYRDAVQQFAVDRRMAGEKAMGKYWKRGGR
jgi:hypothetical protein